MSETLQNMIVEEARARIDSCGEATKVVEIDQLDEYSPEDGDVIIAVTSPIRQTEYDCQGNPPSIGWMITLKLRAMIIQDDDDSGVSIDSMLSDHSSRVSNAITKPANWWTFGGNALLANIGNTDREVDGQTGVYEFSFDIFYRTAENNLYTRR